MAEQRIAKAGPEAEFKISRELDAPRELVWKAWTDPKRLAEWWGPKGMEVGIHKLELKPGGTFLYSMTMPDGKKLWGKFVYREITPPEKLVFVVSFSDENEGITTHPMAPDWPQETLSTIILTEKNGKTTMSMVGVPINATQKQIDTFIAGFTSMQGGWGGTFEKLGNYLSDAQKGGA
ncbi:MAG: SRPBCC domain-containing protein [Candidatus Sumerlaeota bacterium]